ncbi:hypothetical protein [Sphingorhabdus sp. Alg239-R122]|uniref:hypothetical protein n=1 Tax=Sphingorhabdus sp. Alg239-R122 TaxID=2305989 RepID=UPI0013DD0077|nr:hypothetical protein [Sphingorhabdus sp. Alg239-R122]
MRRFTHTACFDWSGQNVARPNGIALAVMGPDKKPALIENEHGWSREGALEWLVEQARIGSDILIGIDLSAALPFTDQEAYFPGWNNSPESAKALWALVDDICSDDLYLSARSIVEHPQLREYFRHAGYLGNAYGQVRSGRLRMVEEQSRIQQLANPYSCFNLVGAAQVGKSSLTGMRVLHRLESRIPIWPFDPVPAKGPLIVEIYTSIAAVNAGLTRGRTKLRDRGSLDKALDALGVEPHSPLAEYDDHKTDALMTAAWLAKAAENRALWAPKAMNEQIAATEGWTFGVF